MTEAIEQLLCRCIEWGPGLILALIMLFGLYRLIRGIGIKIVGALDKPTDAFTMQAKSMDRLTHSLEEYVTRDKLEHKEIIILQKIILEEIGKLGRDKNGGN